MSSVRAPARVGIEKIRAYPSSAALSFRDLARARGDDPEYAPRELLVESRAINPPWEDPITQAVNAAKAMLTPEDIADIELLVFGSESSIDQAKPMTTWVHKYLGLGPNVRNFETKHACYSGTSALMTAAHWVASGVAPGKKALVVTADQSRFNPHVPWEYVMGAAATAMLVSDNPRFLELELASNGYWSTEVGDTFRPTSKAEAGNTESSLYCYLDALEGAFDHYLKKAGDIDFEAHTKKNIYHVPFGGITFRAHRTVMRQVRRMKKSEAVESFEARTKPSLHFNAQFGGSYASAIFLAMMGVLEKSDDVQPGDRLSVFSYGSGSCAEFYTAKAGDDFRAVLEAADLDALCKARRMVSVREYEAMELVRSDHVDNPDFTVPLDTPSGLWASHYEGQGKLVLTGNDGFFRQYRWS